MSNVVADESLSRPSQSTDDWFSLTVFEWMWRADGLAIRPGAELMVYATIYRASVDRDGTFVATIASMGAVLDYPRETISRAVHKLLKSGLVWVVGRIQESRSGKAVRCYAVTQSVIDRTLGRTSAEDLRAPRDAFLQDAKSLAGASAESPRTQHSDFVEGATSLGGASAGDSRAPRDAFLQDVTNRHAAASPCDDPSRDQRNDSSHVTNRHMGKNGSLPAQKGVFNKPLINSYSFLTYKEEKGDDENHERITLPACMTRDDFIAFQALVQKSVRPVDAEYLNKNLREFGQLIAEGVPADVIIEAYDGYAAYQAQMLEKMGENRPLHLLHWLQQRPNKNIQYVLNARDRSWRSKRSQNRGARPTHERPNLSRCLDKKVPVWFVTDERGSRMVANSRGVESPTRAMALYQAMYDSETSDARC